MPDRSRGLGTVDVGCFMRLPQGCIEERYTLLVQVTRAHAFA
ncbi:hypothetical protein BURPS305_4057 [Burkholderia pseudomallei 305]|nr:hypothetical protein BURPS305_4057 [Burkholderia pseudomallei 305]